MSPEPVIVPTRKWIRVPCDVLADQRLAECSGFARILFAALWPGAVADPRQTIGKVATPCAIGWLMSASGEPATFARLSTRTGIGPAAIEECFIELQASRKLVRSDSGAWGLVGWGARSPEAQRQQKYRTAAKAAAKPAKRRGRAAA